MAYVSQTGAALELNIHRESLIHYVRTGRFIDPDVRIGVTGERAVTGYDDERVRQWGRACGFILPGGQFHQRGIGEPPSVPDGDRPAWWHTRTGVYLSRSDLAMLYRISVMAIDARSRRGSLPDVAVMIEKVRGWDLDAALAFGKEHALAANKEVVGAAIRVQHQYELGGQPRHDARLAAERRNWPQMINR